jgi:hypothetical protein
MRRDARVNHRPRPPDLGALGGTRTHNLLIRSSAGRCPWPIYRGLVALTV